MAGKTLIGIGKDEAARMIAEVKAESEAKARREAEAAAQGHARPGAAPAAPHLAEPASSGPTPAAGLGETPGPTTWRTFPAAPAVPERSNLPDSDRATLYSGPTIVDDNKIADALKKLRSLDDPLGPLSGVTQAVTDPLSAEVTRVAAPSELGAPSARDRRMTPSATIAPGRSAFALGVPSSTLTSRPTPPAGMAPVPAPTAATSDAPAALSDEAAAEAAARTLTQRLARGTAIGRSISAPLPGQMAAPPTVDDRAYKGTLHGRSVHLPDDSTELPAEPAPSSPTATLVMSAQTMAAIGASGATTNPAFGEEPPVATASPLREASYAPRPLRFREPVNASAPPPARRRLSITTRATIGVVVGSTLAVVIFAWVHGQKAEPVYGTTPSSHEPAAATAPTPPPPAVEDPEARARAFAGPSVAPPPPAPVAPTAVETKPVPVVTDRLTDRPSRPAHPPDKPARAEGKSVKRDSPRRPVDPPATTRAPSPAPSLKPATRTGKRGGEDDPDGTLPLQE
jgi:hypothetical protein